MALVVRVATVLLWVAFAALSFTLGEIRFAVAATAIFCLAEIALALRARAARRAQAFHPSRLAAASVSYTDQGGVLAVTLSGTGEGRRPGTPCVVVSRAMAAPGAAAPGGPCLELSARKGSIRAGIEDAYLSPHLLQLAVDARAAQALGADAVCVTLPAGTDQRLLERALGRILRGVPFTSERSMPQPAAHETAVAEPS